MITSAITIFQDVILETIRHTAPGEWKIFVLDQGSKRLVEGVVCEDDILEANITNIEQIEEKRSKNPTTDALYFLSPEPHIVDCLMADFSCQRYRKSYLVWTSVLSPQLRTRLDQSTMAREQVVRSKVLNIDFHPRESHLITFRDPWSFPTLFHPACNQLVRRHLDDLARKIVSICVLLGEYPIIRYYNPQNPLHEAGILCSHLARFIQLELDQYTKFHEEFPPPSTRPRGALIITDRSMDLFAPLVHEFTYQAMIHDLLPIEEGDRVIFKGVVNTQESIKESKSVEISEKDNIWVTNRHLHMKDLIDKLVIDFEKFRAANPQFGDRSNQPSSLNNIKDMLAGLPQFQEGKELYSLHLGMAQEAMNIFQTRRLADIATIEQSLATGLDEENKKPKNMADQVVRLLDDDAIASPDRLRLIIGYLLYRNGLLPSDIQKLLAHAKLPPQDGEVIHNLELLGAHVTRQIKDTRPMAQPFFPKSQPLPLADVESGLSRFNPTVKSVLEKHIRGTLDSSLFPFTKPQLDGAEGSDMQENISQASLRSAKPTWARTRSTAAEPRQRVIVFMAGGATYSESRACYEISESFSKDVFLATSHMLNPSLFLRQVGDLSVDKRRLNLPVDQPKPKAPAHLFEKDPPPPLPSANMAAMNPSHSKGETIRSASNGMTGAPPTAVGSNDPHNKLAKKEKEKEKDTEKKKKLHFFSSKK